MSDVALEFSKTGELVRKLMLTDERCRNDDKWLCYRVYQETANKHGKKIFIPFELFQEFPSFETITRVRRVVQNNEGTLLPTDPIVRKNRKSRESDIREMMMK